MNVFRPSRLTLARKRRGLTKTRLAEQVELTARSISAFENAELIPAETTIKDLANALGFPSEFFFGPEIDEPKPDSVSFRAASSMTSAQRDAAIGAGALAVVFSEWMEGRFSLPKSNVPISRGQTPEAAAVAVRSAWGLGVRPIKNIVHLLESQGVRVFSLAEECREVNAFSLWRKQCPYIFLNTLKSSECSRFDAAHELGHLVLHSHGSPQGREAENEADAFASAFLMPRESMIAEAPRFPSITNLIRLKKVWQVSLAALVYRLHTVGVLSDWHYRTIYMEISQRGFRTNEPDSIRRETSQLLSKVFSLLKNDGISKSDLAKDLLLNPSELDALVFGLTLTSLEGGRPNAPNTGQSNRPDLRIV